MSVAFSLSTDGQAATDPLEGAAAALPKPLRVVSRSGSSGSWLVRRSDPIRSRRP